MTDKQGFEVEVLSRGSYFDNKAGDGKAYQIDTFTLRLSPAMLNAYIRSEMMNARECYEDGPAGDKQWDDYQWTIGARRNLWRAKVLDALNIDPDNGSVAITQVVAEVFAAAWIRELEG